MNQILISKRIYVTKEMKRKKMTYKILYILSIITVIILLGYFVMAEAGRNEQEALGQEILEQISNDNTTIQDRAIVISLDETDYNPDEEEIIPIESEDLESDTVKSTVKTKDGNSYDTEAILSFTLLFCSLSGET